MSVKREIKAEAKSTPVSNSVSAGGKDKFYNKLFEKNNVDLSSGKTLKNLNKEDFVLANKKRDSDRVNADVVYD